MMVPNSLDPDKARCFVGPDLGPNCGERLSADESSSGQSYLIKINNKTCISTIALMKRDYYSFIFLLIQISWLH